MQENHALVGYPLENVSQGETVERPSGLCPLLSEGLLLKK